MPEGFPVRLYNDRGMLIGTGVAHDVDHTPPDIVLFGHRIFVPTETPAGEVQRYRETHLCPFVADGAEKVAER